MMMMMTVTVTATVRRLASLALLHLVFFFFFSVGGVADGARILVVQPINVRSHAIVTQPLFEALAARGHRLTVYTSFPRRRPNPNVTEIDLSGALPTVVSNFSVDAIRAAMPNRFVAPFYMADIERRTCQLVFETPEMQRLLRSQSSYDLVITETFASDCFTEFAHRFSAPLVTVVTSSALPWLADRTGLPDHPAYIPNYHMDYSAEMTLAQRAYNTLVLLTSKATHRFYAMPKTEALVRKYFGEGTPPLEQLALNTSLTFVNSHFALSMSRPFPPNVVEIGGIHLQRQQEEEEEPLPEDMAAFLDGAKNGAVVVSFGSMVRASSLPPATVRRLLAAFGRLPQRVLFKFEEPLPDAPPNVMVSKWLPQAQLVADGRVVALLLHGGLSSTIEAVQYGKPLVGVPFYADQYLNVKAVARRGAGILLDADHLTEDNVVDAITRVTTDPRYKENVERLSRQFRDRPLGALESAVFWTEYVMRHGGAVHLRPASLRLPFYRYLLLDVAALLLAPLLLFAYFLYFLFFRAVQVSPNDHRNYDTKKTN